VADERTVDVDERRDPPPEPGSGPPVIASVAKLSPIQQAWSDYVDHGLKCPKCRTLDAGPCGEAERLHSAFQAAGDTAFERLADETP
jgi:hypothetical protein